MFQILYVPYTFTFSHFHIPTCGKLWKIHVFQFHYGPCWQSVCNICLFVVLQWKRKHIPYQLGHDTESVSALQRRLANFKRDLVTLGEQVK